VLAKALSPEMAASKTTNPDSTNALSEMSMTPAIGKSTEQSQRLTMQAESLLDRLAQYHQMLADPAISLKQMRPTVERLIAEQRNLSQGLRHIQGNDELTAILNTLLVNTTLEIDKFTGGSYA
jgi:hypothetical protein